MSTAGSNGTKEAFKRAALYQSCKQSSILSNIDFENTTTDALVDLVNHYNSQSIRELPIILSKMVVKGALTFVTNKYPKSRSYINPENIRVRVEDDEMAHLISTSSKRTTNLVTLVVKNLAVSTLGSSIEQIRRELLETNNSSATANSSSKITVEADIPEEMNLVEPPTVYSDFGSPEKREEFESPEKSEEFESPEKREEYEEKREDCESKHETPTTQEEEDEIQVETNKVEQDEKRKCEDEEASLPKRMRIEPEQIDLISEDEETLMDDDDDDDDNDEDEEMVVEDVKSNDEIPLPPPPPSPVKPKITDVAVFRPSEMKNNFDFFNLVRSEMPNTSRLMNMSNKYQFDNDD